MAHTLTTGKIDKYLTAREVAELLAITPTTLYLWAKAGRGPRGIRIGREMRWSESEVARWIDGLDHR